MRTYFLLLVLFVNATLSLAQDDATLILEIEDYRAGQNASFADPEESILLPEDLKTFKELDFYPIDLEFLVTATLLRTPDAKPFKMPTSTSRMAEYVQYGELHFEVKGTYQMLPIYQDTDHENQKGYEDYLFLPFTDPTNADTTYGGGRYLEMWIPEEGNTMVIDFNKAYNPYCAYSPRYSCPIPPKANNLTVAIEAGVKQFKGH